MPEFRQQDKIQGITSYDPGVVEPVQDNTTAQAIGTIADTAITGMKIGQRQAGRNLASEFEEEVYAQVRAQGQEKEAVSQAIREGNKLSKSRVAMGEAQFKARAEARLREMMAANPFFSDEIANGFAQVTGFDPRGAGMAAAFELAKLQQARSPEEDALEAYRKRVTETALVLGTDSQTAANLITQQERLAYDAKQTELELTTAKPRQRAYFSSTANQMANDFLSRVIASATENGGKLSPEQLSQFQREVNLVGANYMSAVEAKLAEKGMYVQDTAELAAQQKRMVEYMNTYLSSESNLEFLKQNIEYVQLEAQAVLLGNADARSLGAVRDVMGDQAAGNIIASWTNPAFKSLLENNPKYSSLLAFTDNQLQTQGITALAKAVSGQQLNDQEALLAFQGITSGSDIKKSMSQEQIDSIMASVPGGLDYHTTTKGRAEVASGTTKISDIENQAKLAAKAARASYMNQKDGERITDISMVEVGTSGRVRRRQVKDQDGNNVPDEVYTSFMSIYRNAAAFPELWEGKFESAEEYTREVMLGPNKPKVTEEAPKEEPKAPEVSLTPEETLGLRVAAFKKQYPDLVEFLSDEEIARELA